MFCTKCGKENAAGAAFCTGCGSSLGTAAINQAYSKPSGEVMPKRKKKANAAAIALGAVCIVLAIALALSLTGVIAISGTAGAVSKSFSSPEDAVMYFAERLEKGDFKGALSACAIHEMAAGFDYKAFAERIKSIQAIQLSYLPTDYEQYIAYNASKFEQQILMQMTCFTVSMNLSDRYENLINGVMTPLEGDSLPGDLIDQLDPANTEGLKVVDIAKMNMHDDKRNRENQKKQAEIYGADDAQFRTVLYELKGDYYIGGFTLLEYGGRWLIQSMSDPLAGISAYGTPLKVSDEAEFYDMVE